jgi:hypothetical protein
MSVSSPSRRTRPWWLQPGCIAIGLVALLLLVGSVGLYLSFYQGRDLSRVTGVPVRIALPPCVRSREQIVSISFHSARAGETIKDVTYLCDGRMFSQEYNDFGVLQGSIEWVFNNP